MFLQSKLAYSSWGLPCGPGSYQPAQNLLLQACPAGSEPGSRCHSWERGPAWKAELIFLAPAPEGLGVCKAKASPSPGLLGRFGLAVPGKLMCTHWSLSEALTSSPHLTHPPWGIGVMLPQAWRGQGVLLPALSLGLAGPRAYLVSAIDRLTHRSGTDAGTQQPGCYF